MGSPSEALLHFPAIRSAGLGGSRTRGNMIIGAIAFFGVTCRVVFHVLEASEVVFPYSIGVITD